MKTDSYLEELLNENDPRYCWEVIIEWKDPVQGPTISIGTHVRYEYALTALQAIQLCTDRGNCAPESQWNCVTSHLRDPGDEGD